MSRNSWKRKRNPPPDTESEGDDYYRLKASSMIKLFVLMPAMPAINLLAIFLTLEKDTTVSFR